MRFIVDAHCHIMTFSRGNIGTFIDSLAHRPLEYLRTQISAPKYLLATLFSKNGSTIRNTIAVADNDAAAIIGLMHDDLAGTIGPLSDNPILSNGKFHVLGEAFDGMIVCPLLIDFSRPAQISPNIYYNQPTRKNPENMILEIIHGIRQYLREHNARSDTNSAFFTPGYSGRLVVRPFLGIDPTTLSEDETNRFLRRFFSNFSRSLKKQIKASLALERWDGSLKRIPPAMFAGVKLYPPLGFDPWPESGEQKLSCMALYRHCEAKRIPITTHCDDGGYRTIPLQEAELYTDPRRWIPVLEKFPNLYLNFAHFGEHYRDTFNGKHVWTNEITELMLRYPNVHADVSFNGCDPEYWNWLEKYINNLDLSSSAIVRERLIFGTDFLINLLKIDSYRGYIRGFLDSNLDTSLKRSMMTDNPMRFLFDT